ncbi:hypothetical protein AMECASPLE_000308 [Ameca splendens]|uniref:Uncharacterized protein n=1 Tax=Ameca splendens TaxID=208324 RepID=A0ABV0YKY9_9TELE
MANNECSTITATESWEYQETVVLSQRPVPQPDQYKTTCNDLPLTHQDCRSTEGFKSHKSSDSRSNRIISVANITSQDICSNNKSFSTKVTGPGPGPGPLPAWKPSHPCLYP